MGIIKKLKTKCIKNSTNEIIKNNEIAPINKFYYPKPIDEQGEARWDIEHIIFFYISDIHLTHRVYNKFGEGKATKEEIHHYIRCLVREMVNSIGTKPLPFSYLLIAGDTSSRFEFTNIFYKELIKHWAPREIVVVAGNHELIDPWFDMEENIETYRGFFYDLGINFLHNDLLYMENTEYIRKCKILHEEEILKMGESKLREKVQNSAVSILGGIGFSGLNKEFNALQINYGKSFYELSGEEALQKDIQETNRFNAIYKKLLKTSGKNKVIILTHTPKRDWNADEYNSSWIYLNGHNHRNYCEVSEKCKIYADNQIGYKKVKNIGLKYFNCDSLYDIFIYYKDGIHKITREQYINFNRGKIISMQFNRKYGDIYMLKKNGIYMFMIYCGSCENSIFKKLYLLDGGKPRKLERNKLEDLDYYYGNLEKVEAGIKLLLHRNKYTEKQQQLSRFIKQIGGSGKIHGCIVDINFFCHLYVNYIDGKVTPYFAYDKESRFVYKDLKTLLQANDDCKLMADNYLRFEREFVQNLPSVQYSNSSEEFGSKECIFDKGKYIYDISTKKVIKMQYCTEKNVVRIWDEKLFKDVDKIYNQQIDC